MKHFVVYNADREILRSGSCQNSTFYLQAGDGEFVIEGKANTVTQKVEFDGFDVDGQPINPRLVDKTPQEIAEATYIPVIVQPPFEKQPAQISNEQWQSVLGRLDKLEKGN